MYSDDAPSETLLSDIAAKQLANGRPGAALARQLTFALFALTFAFSLIASGILYWATLATLQYADDQVVDKRAGTVIDILLAESLNHGLLAHEVNEDNQGPRQIFMRVVSPHEPIQLETEGMKGLLGPEMFPDPKSLAPLAPKRATIELPDGRSFRAASFRVPISALQGGVDTVLQVATDTSLDKESLVYFRRVLYLVIGGALPLSALLSSYVIGRTLTPLGRITSAAQRIDGGNLDQRIALSGLPAELHELGMHFNSMLARLEVTWLGLRHYADTIAHEMRTPLNRMRLACEIALNKAESVDEFREVLGAAVSECERLARLLQGLLFLARVESKQASIAPRCLPLCSFVTSICDYFDAEAADKQIILSLVCDHDVTVEADRDLLQQALSNLISNAIAHTPRGGRIDVGVRPAGDGTTIWVKDSGAGIAPENQAHVFERFYRGNAKAESAERLGLGLHIVKGIIDLHGGRVTLTSAPGEGTCVSIYLPALLAPGLAKVPAGSTNPA